MSASANTIWQVPVYLPYVQPPLTRATVEWAEREIGHKLPDEYLEILKVQNGGYIRYSLPESVHRCISGIGPHFPSLIDPGFQDGQGEVSFSLDGLVPFDGDGHWYYCFDYRRNSKIPSITYADIELDRESPVAGSFREYLTMLQLDVEDKFVIDVADDLIPRLSAALSTTFEPPESWAHGFPLSRAGLGTEDDPEWVWLSPNRVPKGFVRPDDSRYLELKHSMSGTALRFPELPDGSYILETTDGVRSRVVEACRRSQIPMLPMREYVKEV